jgi:Ubiquitin carboxyl-terminal hydrolase
MKGGISQSDAKDAENIRVLADISLSDIRVYEVPVIETTRKISQVIEIVKGQTSCYRNALYLVTRQSAERIDDCLNFEDAIRRRKGIPESSLWILGTNERMPVKEIDVTLKLDWYNKQSKGHVKEVMPMRFTQENFIQKIQNIREIVFNDCKRRSGMTDDDRSLDVLVEICDTSKSNLPLCVLCQSVECRACFNERRDDLKEYIDSIFKPTPASDQLNPSSSSQNADTYFTEVALQVVMYAAVEVDSLVKPQPDNLKSLEADSKRIDTIEDLLNVFTSTETLKDEDKINCTSCNQKNCSKKHNTIVQLPKLLVLHIKRFKYTKDFRVIKSKQLVTFEEELDMHKYLSEPNILREVKDEDSHSKTMAKIKKPTRYTLRSVVNHIGSLQAGHYYAYARDDDAWHEYNDTHVTKIDIRDVVSTSAYILFYERE